jgi:hypothetical protein
VKYIDNIRINTLAREQCKKHVEWNVDESMFLMQNISPKRKMQN